jgi:hypothetical protein
MTDRAEPGVTPLTDKRRYNEQFGLPPDACNCHHGSARWCPVHTQADFDAATPRPGLVERVAAEWRGYDLAAALADVERDHAANEYDSCVRCRVEWPCSAELLRAALASGTGEPGLDVERLARSLRALEVRDELTVADGFLGGRDDGDYVTFATSIAAAYANDKGADPTPEPK